MPSAAKIIAENSLDAGAIAGSGKGGRILKEDAQAAASGGAKPAAAADPRLHAVGSVIEVPAFTRPESGPRPKKDREERVRMTKLRKTIATRLKQAQNNAAMLTTFNEVDMTALMALRNQYKDSFEKKHGVKLGFMSLLREGLHRRAEGAAGGQRRDRRRRAGLQELLRHRRRGRHAERAWSCRWCATPTA